MTVDVFNNYLNTHEDREMNYFLSFSAAAKQCTNAKQINVADVPNNLRK